MDINMKREKKKTLLAAEKYFGEGWKKSFPIWGAIEIRGDMSTLFRNCQLWSAERKNNHNCNFQILLTSSKPTVEIWRKMYYRRNG